MEKEKKEKHEPSADGRRSRGPAFDFLTLALAFPPPVATLAAARRCTRPPSAVDCPQCVCLLPRPGPKLAAAGACGRLAGQGPGKLASVGPWGGLLSAHEFRLARTATLSLD